MAKRSPNYVLVLLMLGVATGVTYWARTRPPIVPTGADLASLPVHIGEWSRDGNDWVPEKDVLEGWVVDAKDFLTRTYVAPDGSSMSLMVVYKGMDRRGWHPSEACFMGAGYNVSQSLTDVPYAGKNASAVKLVAVNPTEGTRDIAIYLFAQERRTESNFVKQQMSMALSRLRPSKYGWAFVRVTSPVTTSEEDTMKQIREFFQAASGPLVKALTTPPRRAASR
jgi:EpsI family protein